MQLIPIQVTQEGVVIPKVYLQDAAEVEVVVEADYVLVRPKPKISHAKGEVKAHRYSFIGVGQTRNPRASVEAEDILEREADRREGWSLKP